MRILSRTIPQQATEIKPRIQLKIYRLAAEDKKTAKEEMFNGEIINFAGLIPAVVILGVGLGTGNFWIIIGDLNVLIWVVALNSTFNSPYKKALNKDHTANFFMGHIQQLEDFAMWVETKNSDKTDSTKGKGAYVLISEWAVSEEGWRSMTDVMVFKVQQTDEGWVIEHYWKAAHATIYEDGRIQIQNYQSNRAVMLNK